MKYIVNSYIEIVKVSSHMNLHWIQWDWVYDNGHNDQLGCSIYYIPIWLWVYVGGGVRGNHPTPPHQFHPVTCGHRELFFNWIELFYMGEGPGGIRGIEWSRFGPKIFTLTRPFGPIDNFNVWIYNVFQSLKLIWLIESHWIQCNSHNDQLGCSIYYIPIWLWVYVGGGVRGNHPTPPHQFHPVTCGHRELL